MSGAYLFVFADFLIPVFAQTSQNLIIVANNLSASV